MVLSYGAEQGGSSASESSPSRGASPLEGVIEDMQSRIKRLERWHAINTVFPLTLRLLLSYSFDLLDVYLLLQVLWTFLMSAFLGYSLYQRKRQ